MRFIAFGVTFGEPCPYVVRVIAPFLRSNSLLPFRPDPASIQAGLPRAAVGFH